MAEAGEAEWRAIGAMSKLVKITCDNCEKDLTVTGNCMAYRIALVNERIPSRNGVVTAMTDYPHLGTDCHFCDVRCLAAYMQKVFAKYLIAEPVLSSPPDGIPR